MVICYTIFKMVILLIDNPKISKKDKSECVRASKGRLEPNKPKY